MLREPFPFQWRIIDGERLRQYDWKHWTMRQIPVYVTALAITLIYTHCYAGCDCSDWVNKRGYCVDYIKSKIPTFPVPKTHSETAALKNKEITDAREGEVAIFKVSNYWHVAYVEKVHRNKSGVALAIDVSEMNFGGPLSFDEFKATWNSTNESEWKKALCCGVTDKYDQTSSRKKVPLATVMHIWSPTSVVSNGASGEHETNIIKKISKVLNRFFLLVEKSL